MDIEMYCQIQFFLQQNVSIAGSSKTNDSAEDSQVKFFF